MQNEIIVGIVIALVSSALGWAVSQVTVGRKTYAAISDVKLAIEKATSEMKLSAERATNDAHRAQDEVSAVKTDVTLRISGVVGLVTKVLETADKLIELVREQNARLDERSK